MMVEIVVYKYDGRHYLATLGCCPAHQTTADIFTEGGEEVVFTIFRAPGQTSAGMLSELVIGLDKHGITDIEVLEIYLDRRIERMMDGNPHLGLSPHTVH